MLNICRKATNIVKWILCEIILVIPQRKVTFRQINETHINILSVTLMVNIIIYCLVLNL